MEKSKLIEVLFTCDSRERRLFRQWLLSPIHNQRTDILLLYDYLCATTSPQREEAWHAIHPNEPFDDARMRQVMFFLTKQLDDFLAWQEIQSDNTQIELAKLKVYRRRQLEKPFKSTLTGIQTYLEERPLRNGRYLRELSMVELETYEYKSMHRRDTSLNLQETADALDRAYFAEKLRISCLMLSHQSVNREAKYHLGPIADVIAYIEQHDLVKMPALAAYYHCYFASLDRANETHFDALCKLITEEGHLFPTEELRGLYLFAVNFCIYWMNNGAKAYQFKAFELYKYGVQLNVLLENGLVSRFTFLNVVVNAISVKEFQWAEDFIQNYQEYLEPQHLGPTVQIAKARLFFERGQYDLAQKVLHGFESSDVLHVLFAKILLAKIYYKHLEFEPLESLLDSMSVYLKRKTTIDIKRLNGYKNFIKILRLIIHTYPLTATKKAEIRKRIGETEHLLERHWLLELMMEAER